MYLHSFITYISIEWHLGTWNIYNWIIKDALFCNFPADYIEVFTSISFSNLLSTFLETMILTYNPYIYLSICVNEWFSAQLQIETPGELGHNTRIGPFPAPEILISLVGD